MNAANRIPIVLSVLVLVLAAAVAADEPASPRDALMSHVDAMLAQAKDKGAHKHCPRSYEAAEAALAEADAAVAADPDGAAAAIAAAEVQARRALSRIEFIRDLRSHKYGWEAAVVRYDQLVDSVARNAGFTLAPELSGHAAGRAVADTVSARRAANLSRIDSLAYLSRDLQQWVDVDQAALDSLVTKQQEEITALRHQVWELEIRAGVAEADRDKALHQVAAERERRELVRSLGEQFAPEEGEVILTPEGDVRIVLTGLKFSSGSAWLNPNYDPLLDRMAEIIQRFPGVPVVVEGHTDNTGSRETNQGLSQERAQRVADALLDRMATDEVPLEAVGVGPDRPIADNGSAAGRARNRRIEVLISAGME